MDRWRYIIDEPRRGPLNMAIDEALALNAGRERLTTLRVYTFDPPCITVGRFQSLEGFVDVDSCAKAGVEIARRPTGGLAILHKDDFTYGCTRPWDAGLGSERDACFRQIAGGIVAALGILGLDASITSHREKRGGPGWCFEREFGVDIEWHSRKICGSAQRVAGGSLLQHGSLFLKDNGGQAAELSGQPEEAGKPAAFASLAEACGREVRFEEMALAFSSAFEEACGIRLERGELSGIELELAGRLLAEKYDDSAWTRGDFGSDVCDIIVPNNSAGDQLGRQRC
ncbi:MAG: lipoate--protein ligase family protein [Candidatus Geothermincolia bacterium]